MSENQIALVFCAGRGIGAACAGALAAAGAGRPGFCGCSENPHGIWRRGISLFKGLAEAGTTFNKL